MMFTQLFSGWNEASLMGERRVVGFDTGPEASHVDVTETQKTEFKDALADTVKLKFQEKMDKTEVSEDVTARLGATENTFRVGKAHLLEIGLHQYNYLKEEGKGARDALNTVNDMLQKLHTSLVLTDKDINPSAPEKLPAAQISKEWLDKNGITDAGQQKQVLEAFNRLPEDLRRPVQQRLEAMGSEDVKRLPEFMDYVVSNREAVRKVASVKSDADMAEAMKDPAVSTMATQWPELTATVLQGVAHEVKSAEANAEATIQREKDLKGAEKEIAELNKNDKMNEGQKMARVGQIMQKYGVSVSKDDEGKYTATAAADGRAEGINKIMGLFMQIGGLFAQLKEGMDTAMGKKKDAGKEKKELTPEEKAKKEGVELLKSKGAVEQKDEKGKVVCYSLTSPYVKNGCDFKFDDADKTWKWKLTKEDDTKWSKAGEGLYTVPNPNNDNGKVLIEWNNIATDLGKKNVTVTKSKEAQKSAADLKDSVRNIASRLDVHNEKYPKMKAPDKVREELAKLTAKIDGLDASKTGDVQSAKNELDAFTKKVDAIEQQADRFALGQKMVERGRNKAYVYQLSDGTSYKIEMGFWTSSPLTKNTAYVRFAPVDDGIQKWQWSSDNSTWQNEARTNSSGYVYDHATSSMKSEIGEVVSRVMYANKVDNPKSWM